MNIASCSTRGRAALVASMIAAVFVLHLVTPSGPGGWRWFHVLYQKLCYVPVVLAAACFGGRGVLAAVSAVTGLFAVHIGLHLDGDPLFLADQVGELASLWIIGFAASLLFRRERQALDATRRAHEETLAVLASSLEMHEQETAFHSRRVQEYTGLIADRMGIDEETLREQLRAGALFHDVGKIGIPDRILLKEEGLSEDERMAVRKHPALGAALIGRIGFLDDAREMVLAHHERFDGTGYPQGVAGLDIPVGARIFALADALDALTTDRPYRHSVSFGEASGIIASERGKHFDPDVIDAFRRVPFEEWSEAARRNGVTLRRA